MSLDVSATASASQGMFASGGEDGTLKVCKYSSFHPPGSVDQMLIRVRAGRSREIRSHLFSTSAKRYLRSLNIPHLRSPYCFYTPLSDQFSRASNPATPPGYRRKKPKPKTTTRFHSLVIPSPSPFSL